MHLRSLKKTKKDVLLHDPIGTDKEGNEISLIDILGTEANEVEDKVQLKIEKIKYINTSIFLMNGKRKLSSDASDLITRKNAHSERLRVSLASPVLMYHASKNGPC